MVLDLGEVSRNILLHFVDSGLLFDGFSSSILNSHYGFDTSFVSKIEGASKDEDVKTAILKDLGIDANHVSVTCVEIVRWACRMVAMRAAALAACAIAAVVLHTGNDKPPKDSSDPGVDVGMDGRYAEFPGLLTITRADTFRSVAEFLPNFESRVRDALRLILGDVGEKRISLGLAKDGSGIGGEFIASGANSKLISCSRLDRAASEEGDGSARRRQNRHSCVTSSGCVCLPPKYQYAPRQRGQVIIIIL